MRKLILISILILIPISAHAQDITKPCEQCIDSLSAVTAERDSFKVQMQLMAERDQLKNEVLAMLREQKDFYKSAAESFQTAATERKTANETDKQRIEILREQVADYKVELARARGEVERLKGQRTTIAAVSFGGGVAVGWLLKSNSQNLFGTQAAVPQAYALPQFQMPRNLVGLPQMNEIDRFFLKSGLR